MFASFPFFFHVYAYFPYSVILIQSFHSLIGLPFVHSKLLGREVEDRIVWRFFKDDMFFFFFLDGSNLWRDRNYG